MADSSIFIITKFSSFTDILYQQPGKGKYDKPMQTPLPARAPEVINKSPLDASIDIWALGCVVSWTYIQLSSPVLISHEDIHSWVKAYVVSRDGLELDEDHRAYINEILNSGAQSFTEHVERIMSSQAGPFGISSDVGPVDIQPFASFLLMMLQIDQQKRAPTSKLLDHPFLW